MYSEINNLELQKLNVILKNEVDDSYEIKSCDNPALYLSDFLLEKKVKNILIVTDSNVFPLHYKSFVKDISKTLKVNYLILEAWEENKNIEAVLKICSELVKLNFNRNDYLIALWWGVIWDIVWFATGIFKRWMNFIQIPTTLLSMFDSSVWGKTWIDFENIKNIIGVFKQPKLVLINSDFLSTLLEKEILSGYFEWLKHSILESEEYFEEFITSSLTSLLNERRIENNNLNKFILRNISVKAKIVMEDEKEMWIRKFLNYGHTFGHALESVTNFGLSHWVWVWCWIIFVNLLSLKLWFAKKDFVSRVNNFVLEKLKSEKIDLDKLDFDEIYSKMISDKKNTDISISFVLPLDFWSFKVEKIWADKKDILKKVFEEWKNFVL